MIAHEWFEGNLRLQIPEKVSSEFGPSMYIPESAVLDLSALKIKKYEFNVFDNQAPSIMFLFIFPRI